MQKQAVPAHERVLARVVALPSGCEVFQGRLDKDGYGLIAVATEVPRQYTPRRVHRVVYEALVGPIPDGMVLDHVVNLGCISRACVFVGHLEPVTVAENIRRGQTGKWQARRTHCKREHELTEENTRMDKSGKRVCRTCVRARQRAAA